MMYLHFNKCEYEIFTAEEEPETDAFNPLSTEANAKLN